MASTQANIQELKKELNTDKILIGTDRTLKSLKQGNVIKVYLSNNVAEEVKQDIEYYAGLSKVELVSLPFPNDELGAVCKKPFSISVVGLLR
jgi:large subunit ribosomal protein L30e